MAVPMDFEDPRSVAGRFQDRRLDQKKKSSALELAKILVNEDTSWKLTSSNMDLDRARPHKYKVNVPSTHETGGSSQQQVEQESITPLFIATKSGCTEIVKEILAQYPQAVEHIDCEEHNILHVAIKYRQLEVFKLVSQMEVPMRWLVRQIDKKGNSILHMVGKKRKDYLPERIKGPAVELQEELLWFE
ncbi:ankyrin repeat-containing protein ITN1-like, partial [Fagus crenata]